MSGNSNSGGRNAKTPDEHRAKGTFQKVRHDGFECPDPPQGRPAPPGKLGLIAQAEWDRMVVRMEQSKTSSLVDDAALYQYVQLYAETEEIVADNQRVRKLGISLKKIAGKLHGFELVEAIKKIVDLEYIVSKQTKELRQGHMALRQYLVEFGMTPSARGRVKIQKDPEKKKSKLYAFTGGRAGVTPQTQEEPQT